MSELTGPVLWVEIDLGEAAEDLDHLIAPEDLRSQLRAAGRRARQRLMGLEDLARLEVISPSGLELYAEACGWTLARAHARSGDRIAIASHLGKSDVFDRALADFAMTYADLNEHDYSALVSAVESGRLEATTGI